MCYDENFFGSICCYPLNYINSYYGCSKVLSYWEILSWNFLSKWSSEDGCSEFMVSTSFWMGPDENFLNSSWCSSLESINYSSCFSKLWSDGEILSWNFLSKLSSEYGCSELTVSTSFWMSSDENFLNSSWCSSLNSINSSSYFLKLWSDGENLTWNFLRLITSFWMCSDENMLDFNFRSSLICCRLSSCLLKICSAVSHDTCSSLADESIIILCCLSWYVSLNCCSYYYSCLLLWSHCYCKSYDFEI